MFAILMKVNILIFITNDLPQFYSQPSEASELSNVFMDVLLDEQGINEAVASYMKTWLEERLMDKMLQMVDELVLTYAHDSRAGGVFPQRAGKDGI